MEIMSELQRTDGPEDHPELLELLIKSHPGTDNETRRRANGVLRELYEYFRNEKEVGMYSDTSFRTFVERIVNECLAENPELAAEIRMLERKSAEEERQRVEEVLQQNRREFLSLTTKEALTIGGMIFLIGLLTAYTVAKLMDQEEEETPE